jgi:ABC-type dipeptide/oligopeptide/nickel transport system ATPase component
MREGRAVEEAPYERVFAAPASAYTRMLIDSIPVPVIGPGPLSRGAAGELAARTSLDPL